MFWCERGREVGACEVGGDICCQSPGRREVVRARVQSLSEALTGGGKKGGCSEAVDGRRQEQDG